MSDVDQLLAAFERGELLRPDAAQPSVVDLARALAALVGDASGEPWPGAARLAERIGPADHLVFILADGLGLNLLERLPPGAFLRAHRVGELRSIFPSTTASVLTTFATGAWPGRHGVTGQWTYLPAIGGAAALLPFAARSGGRSLAHLGVGVEQAFPCPPLLGRARRDVLALFPSRLVNSVTSTYFSGSQPREGYETLAQAADAIVERVRAAPAPTYTYLYTPWIDSETHWLGVGHDGVRAVLNELNRVVEHLAAGLAGRARIVLSADHGMLDASVAVRHWLTPTDDLFGLLRFAATGDDRVLYFHVREGLADQFRERARARFGARFFLLSTAEAEELRLFGPGPIAPGVRDRFGDFVLISRGADVIEYVPGGRTGRRVDLNAYHSGLSPAEMTVPLIVI